MNKRIQALASATALACAVAWSTPLFAATPAAPADVGQSVSAQKNIRTQTSRAASELDALILEFDRNGIGDGADVEMLKSIRKVLGTLTQKEMEKVIELLETARKGSPQNVTRALADAFVGQKGISVQLHQLLIEYSRAQDLADIALRLTRLADSENQNMKSGTGLYRSSKGASPRTYNDVQKAQLQVQQSTQQSIFDEAKILLDRLAKLSETADPTTAARLKAVVAAAEKEKVGATLKNAAEDLKNSNLFSAVGKERTARDTLRDLARLVAPDKDPAAALKDAADELAQNIREENFVAKQARSVTAPDKDEVDTVAKLDDQQADIVDSADNVKKDVANLTPEAVPALKAAHDQMQEARKSLAEGKGKEAAAKAEAAAKQMTDARQKLLSEIARLDEAAKADNKIAQAKALKDQIIALRQREEQLQTDTGTTREAKALTDMAPRQTLLLTTDQELQKTAATDFPTVAVALGDAGKGMEQTVDALATRQNGPEATKGEQIAVDNLKKAEKLLEDIIAHLDQVKDQLAKLEKAREKVAKAVDEQTKVELDTNKLAQKDDKKPDQVAKADDKKPDAANKPDDKKPDDKKADDKKPDDKNDQQAKNDQAKPDDKKPDPTAKDLAPKQDQVAKDAKDAAKDIADTAPDAAKPLNDAGKNADDAKAALDKPDPKAADPEAKKALTNLQKGLDAIDKQIADKKKELGEQDDTAQKLADADKAVDQALQDLDNADQDPVQQMKKKQEEVANDLKQMPKGDPDVAKAEKAADEAAKDLDKGDLPKAAEAMQNAQNSMQKAMEKPDAAKGEKLPDISKKQDEVQKQLAAMQAGEKPPTDDGVAQDLSKAAADDGAALPDDANNAMAEAQAATSDAAAQQAAGKANQASKDKAKAALSKAKTAIAMAQAGLGGKDMGQGNGPPEPGQGDQPGPGKEDPNAKGKGERKDANVGNDSQTGGHAGAGNSAYVALPQRDREAIQQSRGEKYPEEYGPMIEQYLKNLSDQTSK